MRLGRAVVAVLAMTLAASGCDRRPERPDVLLVTVESLPFSETSLDGGPIATPTLERLAAEGLRLRGLVSPSPLAAPAALSVLTGLAPPEHGLRRPEGVVSTVGVSTLAEPFAAAGWRTGAFSNVALLPEGVDATAGFEAFMMPSELVALGLPGAGAREGPRSAAAYAQHWLRRLAPSEPAFTWVHFGTTGARDPLAMASEVAELDRWIGLLFSQAEERALRRGVPPVVLFVALRNRLREPVRDRAAVFLLEEEVLRTEAIFRDPALSFEGVDERLAGLDELASLLTRRIRPEPSRLLDREAPEREAVLAESLLPTSALGAQPLRRAVRVGPAVEGEPDRLRLQAEAGDPDWPAGLTGPAAAEVVDEWHRFDDAWALLLAGRAAEARGRLASLLADSGPRARGVRLALALAEAAAGAPEGARKRLEALAAELPSGDPLRRQAVLVGAELERGSGRPEVARELLAKLAWETATDVGVLLQLALVSGEVGDEAGALAAVGRALEARSGDARALAAAARMQLARGRPDLASHALGDALRRRPVDGPLLHEAAEAALRAGDYWTALDRLDWHSMVFGKSAETSFRIGSVYRQEELWSSAVVFFGEALELDESHHASRLGLAEALLHEGSEEDGRAILAVARMRQPDSPLPCRTLLAWLHDSGRLESESEEVERCKAAHPGDPVLLRLLETAGSP